MEAMDIQAVESKLSDVTVTAIPMTSKSVPKELGQSSGNHTTISTVPMASPSLGKDKDGVSKYAQLLAVIEEMGKEVRPSYSGSRSSAERLKRGIVHARILVRECLIETERFQTMSWTTRWRWHSELNADSVEWCPVAPYRHVLVCGTYQLDKEAGNLATKQKRLGRINLFTITEETTELTPIQIIETSGILDQKWCYHTIYNHPVLAVVTSEGGIQLYRLVDEDGPLNLKFWMSEVIGQDILALSLDWSTSGTSKEEASLVVSDSSGNVTVLRVAGGGLEKIGTWNSHGFEAWIAAFNYWNENIFYSGGDDCVFKAYDTRVPDAVVTNRRHGAGVTAVRCHERRDHHLLTGSYDEKLRLWDPRQLKDCLTEVDVNCGIWRLRWHPRKHDLILAACMYGGFRILKLENGALSVVSEYLEHESIAYGADWSFDRDFVATCSFYDCKMNVSEII